MLLSIVMMFSCAPERDEKDQISESTDGHALSVVVDRHLSWKDENELWTEGIVSRGAEVKTLMYRDDAGGVGIEIYGQQPGCPPESRSVLVGVCRAGADVWGRGFHFVVRTDSDILDREAPPGVQLTTSTVELGSRLTGVVRMNSMDLDVTRPLFMNFDVWYVDDIAEPASHIRGNVRIDAP